jgi:hypothetical protein
VSGGAQVQNLQPIVPDCRRIPRGVPATLKDSGIIRATMHRDRKHLFEQFHVLDPGHPGNATHNSLAFTGRFRQQYQPKMKWKNCSW